MTEEEGEVATNNNEGQVTLTQMLKALDKGVASKIEKRLKKLSKRKAVKTPLDDVTAAQVERKAAYSEVSKEIGKWEPVVERNRNAKQLQFPLDRQPDVLPSTAESLTDFKPRNEFEQKVHNIIKEDEVAIREAKKLTPAEQKYLKAVGIEEAKERHLELQRMRVLLGSYGAKMRQQKKIKSKSYRKLLKHERIKKHMKKVETNQDALLDEIEHLKRLRAQERASLKHKNTGKWAKHAKFRAKYDESARQAMLEQIGIAGKLLNKPAMPESDSEGEKDFDDDENSDNDETCDESEVSISDGSEQSEEEPSGESKMVEKSKNDLNTHDRLIVSSELISERSTRKRKTLGGDEDLDSDADINGPDGDGDDNDDEEDDQRRLMSEAFANDDIVGEFKKAKGQLADEEQPKDINLFLPGWGDWAGPGLKISRNKRRKFTIKAKRTVRRDSNLGNVIISERANEEMKELQVKKLPRGIRNEAHFEKILVKPVTGTFASQSSVRETTMPKIEVKMGARIEPLSDRTLRGVSKAKWA